MSEFIIVSNDLPASVIEVSTAGPQGPSGTLEVGSVTTGAAGSAADVSNSGTSTNAVFDFVIPKGDTGDVTPEATAAKNAAEAAASAAAASELAASQHENASELSANTSAASALESANSALSASESADTATTKAAEAVLSAASAYQSALDALGGSFSNFQSTGTANGVAFLNGSKVLSTGSALTFDGTNLGLGGATNPAAYSRYLEIAGADAALYVRDVDTAGAWGAITQSGSNSYLLNNQGSWIFHASNAERMRLTATGLGIGTSSPTNALSVFGNANITGNTTLGDASTDVVTVNGCMAVGGNTSASNAVWVRSNALTGTGQTGLRSTPTGTSAATSFIAGVYAGTQTEATAFTSSAVYQMFVDNTTKGVGSTITSQYGLYIADQTQGTNNYGITSTVSSGTNKWNIYASGTAANYFAGNVGIGTNSPTAKLHIEADSNGYNLKATRGAGSLFESYQNTSGVNYFYTSGANAALVFGTGTNVGSATEKMRLDSAGNLLLGTNLSGGKFRLQQTVDDTTGGITLYSASGDGAVISKLNDGGLTFRNGGSEKMRLDASGSLLIGSTSSIGVGVSRAQIGSASSLTTGLLLKSTSSAISLYASSTSASYLAYGSATSMIFGEAPDNLGTFTERMRLDASGNLGIGTSSPGAKLDVAGSAQATGAVMRLTNSASSSAWVAGDVLGQIDFYSTDASFAGTKAQIKAFADTGTDPVAVNCSALSFTTMISGAFTERMRLTSVGNLGIGTSSPISKLHVNGDIRTDGDIDLVGGAGTPEIRMYQNSGNWAIQNSAGNLLFYDIDATATRVTLDGVGNLGLGVAPSAWSAYKAIQVNGGSFYSLTAPETGVASNGFYDGAWKYINNGFASQYLQTNSTHRWYTAPSGTAGTAITFTQAMMLDANGFLLVGSTSAGAFNSNNFQAIASEGYISVSHSSAKTSGSTYIQFYYGSGGVGSITQSGTTAVAYNTSSDYRLKNITGPITTSGEYIDSLNPVEGTWKTDGSTFVGLIAHEVQEVSRTNVATGEKDGIMMQGMDYSSSEIIANLIAEVKSLRARVSSLESN